MALEDPHDEAWGFPEVWVEVPEDHSASRPAWLQPGLTIHPWEGGVYRSTIGLAPPP